jgi:hypothetical protein
MIRACCVYVSCGKKELVWSLKFPALHRLSVAIWVFLLTSSAEAILKDVEQSPILIGLIGGTGAGKPTLINAMFRMRGLLPAHPSRACTAAVVEVAYNRSDDADTAYRAEVGYWGRRGGSETLEENSRCLGEPQSRISHLEWQAVGVYHWTRVIQS